MMFEKEKNDIFANDNINCFSSEDTTMIEKQKLKFIYQASNFFEAAVNYIALEQQGFHFNFGSYTIPKGTLLYRVRGYEKGKDFSANSEWTPPPHRPQNRANHQGEQALYLNCMEKVCLLETHISEGEKYVLGTYRVEEDIVVGGYLSVPKNNQRLLSIGVVLNAILIAPSRGEKNEKLFDVLDNYFGEVYPENIQWDDVKNNFSLPFKLAVMNKGKEYYKITNKVCDILKKQYPDGVKYSSCYFPLETIDIESNCFNLALYKSGIQKVKFLKHEIKTNSMPGFTSSEVAKIILRQYKN